MTEGTDILLLGTGDFAARIVFDLAVTAATPVSVVVAGRNRQRAAWIRTAAAARAVMFGRPLRLTIRMLDIEDGAASPRYWTSCSPRCCCRRRPPRRPRRRAPKPNGAA